MFVDPQVYPRFGMCSYVHTQPIPMLVGEKPVDGLRPYSPGVCGHNDCVHSAGLVFRGQLVETCPDVPGWERQDARAL